MRWEGQGLAVDDGALPGLARLGLVRSVTTPQFAGITFHEVMCRSALNAVAGAAGGRGESTGAAGGRGERAGAASLPFAHTVNAYRGCSHACAYCFARPTHTYLDLDVGDDFDRQIVVKLNVAEVLRRELRRPSWSREVVALGTNTDPYQRAEGRYALMPGVVGALAESGTPLSVLTKGTLLRRDLALLADAATQVPVSLAVSLAMAPTPNGVAAHRAMEPGTATPRARLDLIAAITEAGLECHLMAAPVLPYLTDSAEDLDALLGAAAAAGARSATVFALHLRGATRGWFMGRLERMHPELVGRYRELYRRGAYAPAPYRERLARTVEPLLRRHGLTRDHRRFSLAAAAPVRPPTAPAPEPTLF